MKYLIVLLPLLISCNGSNTKKPIVQKNTVSQKESINSSKDSLFSVGDFLFDAQKDMQFEVLKQGDKSKKNTKGDTLYADKKVILLGDIAAVTDKQIFKKINFNATLDLLFYHRNRL